MANMNVSYDEMRSAAGQLRNGQGQLEQQLTVLRNFIANLVSGGFVTDQASIAFNETYEQFNNAATSTVANLDILARNLEGSAEALQQVDTEIAARMRG